MAKSKASLPDRLRQYFLDQGYGPGDRIEPELALARRFRAPRAKIREVLTAMCQQGLLERRPRAGTVIRRPDAAQIGANLQFRFSLAGLAEADAVEARRVIESAILPLVVRRITPTQLAALDELVDQMERHLDQPDCADQADRRFHLELLKCCGNQTLAMFSGVINGLFDPRRRRRFQQPDLQRRSAAEHRALLRAIRREDLAQAQEILARHFSHYDEDVS